MSVCYVSAFLDIGRSDWTTYQRNIKSYFNYFTPYIKLFSRTSTPSAEMIVFIDKKYHQQFMELLSSESADPSDPSYPLIQAIPIDIDFMNENIYAWSKLPREREIMASEEYKEAFSERLSHPENSVPEYTLINHSKIDFVNYAMSLNASEYFCWVDFGYFQKPESIPRDLIDINKLDTNKINYQILNPITEKDSDILHTIAYAPERIGGFFFFGRRDKLVQFQDLYHQVLEYFQDNNIADDDQHLALQCYFRNPSLFKLHLIREWHMALVKFQKDFPEDSKVPEEKKSLTDIMNYHGSDKGSGHHNYTLFYEKLFEKRRYDKLKILEIGIGSVNPSIASNMCGKPGGYEPGSSLRGWREYFPNSMIYGCDIDKNILIQSERIETFYLDQTSYHSIKEMILDNPRTYDIIIDDGLHHFPTNWNVLKLISGKLNSGGIYVIEDIMGFDDQIYNEPFCDGKNIHYYPIPNPQNTSDNNILVLSAP